MPHLAGAAHRDRAALEPAAHPACAAAGPFEECLKAYSDVNEINTPSYMGGTLIQKKGETKSAVGAGIWSDRFSIAASVKSGLIDYMLSPFCASALTSHGARASLSRPVSGPA